MNNWLIAPVLVPALMGPLMVLWMRHDLLQQRVFGVIGSLLTLLVAIKLHMMAVEGDVLVYRLGNWPAPFGIVLMLDRLSALMLLLTAILAVTVQLYGIGSGWDRKGWHFHSLWQFQLMGLNGAFLTGDAFNLFVFFEVLLIASYGLMIHGGGPMRLRAGVQYISYNLAGSALFLAALGCLYAVTGTLNMADMAERVARMPTEDTALLRTGAVLLLLVFAIKAAIVPLHFWLPSTYANAPGPVAALFAIMSKVGVYAIIRFFTLVFPQDSVIETIATDLILPAALITLTLGQLGVMGTRSLARLAAFAAIASIGTLMISVARFDAQGLTAGLYYMIHSTLSAAALFLVVDLVAARRGGDFWLRLRPAIGNTGLISALFFATGIAVVGLPPLSGFLGKLMILDATADDPWRDGIWATILVTSLIALVGFGRAGSILFWKSHEMDPEPGNDSDEGQRPAPGPIPTKLETDEPIQDVGDSAAPWLSFTATGALLAGMVVLTVFAGPLTDYLQRTADQLTNPTLYYESVLRQQEGAK
ncbi:MAG: monovalent cation/H+ antiporter subunit D [Paracoccus sp. (in: a-proteobacteria)]|jgi:multicomponent K+:H+ antiporter subunit D|uniref:monovalent cation/H+ antiporter subunit D n=2 Tax=Paracoccus TaxID=265 RepID=UPI000C5E0CF3|nr:MULTISPECIES: monovalent cation/H+ antiporter subunit D [unclassified Paracoccus (in: a-proteobacteria)]MBA48622.1 monovalent cation/H+ antiporter subunit D [Paracoccus sp. (in: a-proteobacteria)]MCS5603880.1 monovalent cation/H+ antiporter subunit D [Paracoccus sp. (in: a-proteobacteria)]MDB2552034.1 monovalent cation/H+ antiporter subunit D [Paracoccus sp. (in: a-proteobacteria)]|tara:strand:- start:3151 stop:4749 length:1599 start_codon:yes stop_codon:yes gene_type:complete